MPTPNRRIALTLNESLAVSMNTLGFQDDSISAKAVAGTVHSYANNARQWGGYLDYIETAIEKCEQWGAFDARVFPDQVGNASDVRTVLQLAAFLAPREEHRQHASRLLVRWSDHAKTLVT